MEYLKKYKWSVVSVSAAAIASIIAYTIWKWSKKIVPFRRLAVDTKKLAAILKGSDLNLGQVACLEGMAQCYYYTYRSEEHKTRQLRRCKDLTIKNRQKYFNELLQDVKYEVKCLDLIYSQICDAVHIPLEVFKHAQRTDIDRQGPDYKIPFNKQMSISNEKKDNGLSEAEATNLVKHLKNEKENGVPELEQAFNKEFKGKMIKEEEKNLFMKLLDYMAYDSIYAKYKLTEFQVRQVMTYYNLNEKAGDEVAEL